MLPYVVAGVQTYPLFLLLGVAIGAFTAIAGARRLGLPVQQLVGPLCVCAGGALVGAKVYSLLERGQFVDPLSRELIHGFRYPGGVLGLLAAMIGLRAVGARLQDLGDILAPAFCFGIATVRLGCFCAGCCFGKVTSIPWAVRFPKPSTAWVVHVEDALVAPHALLSLPIHPLQLYFACHAVALGAGLLFLRRYPRWRGQLFLWFLLLHGAGVFLLEFVRYERALHVQLFSLALALAAGCTLAMSVRREKAALE